MARAEVCAGAIVVRDGRLLLVRRGGAGAAAGTWAPPGGRLEAGERLAEGALRELAEETGLHGRVLGVCGVTEWIDPERHYVIVDHWVDVPADAPARAADDADDVTWADRAALEALPLVEDLHDWLTRHSVLERLR